jgi:hypothetical protein
MTYTFQPYDVLQIRRDGRWLDFTALRYAMEAGLAIQLVKTGRWEGQTYEFRIVRNSPRIECHIFTKENV